MHIALIGARGQGGVSGASHLFVSRKGSGDRHFILHPPRADCLVRSKGPITAPIPPKCRGLLAGLRASFRIGRVGHLPVGLTIYLIWTMVGGLDGRMLPMICGPWRPEGLVRSISDGLKLIAETVRNDASFERSCLVEYPKEGICAIGSVSTRARGALLVKPNHHGFMDVISVFLPTTPNPTSGVLLYVPARGVIYLDMTGEDAA